MKTALAIFAKTAELSPVKTRLAADIGKDDAETFYKLSVNSIEIVAKTASDLNHNLQPHWCLAEEEGINYPQWQSFPALWTGEGGLGERLASISETLLETHDAVIFIGTDSPQISPDILAEAVNMLEANPNEHVAGPALDGGFYLFGSSTPVPREIWEAVAYSVETTLADLENRSNEAGMKIHRLEPQQDVDTVSDLRMLKATLKNKKPELLPAQAELLIWLETGNF